MTKEQYYYIIMYVYMHVCNVLAIVCVCVCVAMSKLQYVHMPIDCMLPRMRLECVVNVPAALHCPVQPCCSSPLLVLSGVQRLPVHSVQIWHAVI